VLFIVVVQAKNHLKDELLVIQNACQFSLKHSRLSGQDVEAEVKLNSYGIFTCLTELGVLLSVLAVCRKGRSRNVK